MPLHVQRFFIAMNALYPYNDIRKIKTLNIIKRKSIMSNLSTLQEIILCPNTLCYLSLPIMSLANGECCGQESTLVTVLNRTAGVLGLIPAAILQVVEAVLKFALALFACVLVLPFEMGFTNSSFASSTAVQLFHGGVASSISIICVFEAIGRCFAPGSIEPEYSVSMLECYGKCI